MGLCKTLSELGRAPRRHRTMGRQLQPLPPSLSPRRKVAMDKTEQPSWKRQLGGSAEAAMLQEVPRLLDRLAVAHDQWMCRVQRDVIAHPGGAGAHNRDPTVIWPRQ